MMAIRKDFVTIHGEMVLLKNYSSLNFAGIIKILKKYDKRTGGLLRVHFTQLTLRQPFFTTEPLTRLVHECEENLELLFPLEAEVVESNSKPDTGTTDTATASSSVRSELFVRILDEEVEKFNDFYVDKEEEFVIRFKELKERIEQVKEKSWKDGNFTSESEFSDEMMAIRKDFVTIHGEMVLLKNYSSLNFAGIIKILKKYDKRTGGLLRVHFTQLTLRQPFFTTEPLTRLVHECEENLELLFPLEAEVVESNSKPDTGTTDTATASSSIRSVSVDVETSDVYRRTIDAMRTIKGLKKESSTFNPLSFASIFGNQDVDTGAITNGDSPPTNPSTFHNENERNHDDGLVATP
ncbi:SPX domain containing protein [Artemisia annua]|uniref:SPX domain containing protein n=1 Tax=Artemisia annua TaxID=35608 RepID=A0A2U1LBU6_ARTAN|nr:SPX domain containing protein [Artemisia annua]